jgi:hypothetical protein
MASVSSREASVVWTPRDGLAIPAAIGSIRRASSPDPRPAAWTMAPRTRRLLRIGGALYLLGVGMLAGVLVERLRFDGRRAEILGRYQAALQANHADLMAIELTAQAHARQPGSP